MIVLENDTLLSVEERIAIIRDTIDSAKIMGLKIGAMVVKTTINGQASDPLLCLYLECQNGRVTSQSGLPAFPMFFDHWVIETLYQRGLMEVVKESTQSGVTRWVVKFSDRWV